MKEYPVYIVEILDLINYSTANHNNDYTITGRHEGVRYTSLSKIWDSQLAYIIHHLATETGNSAKSWTRGQFFVTLK